MEQAFAILPRRWRDLANPGCSKPRIVHYAFLNAFYPDQICAAWDPVDILCSMERNFRKAGLQDPGLVNHSDMLNTSLAFGSITGWTHHRWGWRWSGCWRSCARASTSSCCSSATRTSAATPAKNWSATTPTLAYYEGHDFNNVEQITVEDDEVYAIVR